MNIRNQSAHFSVWILDHDLDRGAEAKVRLSKAGYQSQFFQDMDLLLTDVKNNPPHVVIISTQGLKISLNDFIEKLMMVSAEIRIIFIGDIRKFDILAKFYDYGMEWILDESSEQIHSQILWSVDRLCEKLFFTFQNEQVIEQLNLSQKKESELRLEAQKLTEKLLSSSTPQAAMPSPVGSINQKLEIYSRAQSKDDVILGLMNLFGSRQGLFFKYIPSLHSFLLSHVSSFFASRSIQGIGAQLNAEDLKRLMSDLLSHRCPDKIELIAREQFQMQSIKIFPVFHGRQIEGICVYSDPQLLEELNLFYFIYTRMMFELRIHELEVQDPITELFNKNYYLKSLFDEIARAKRTTTPVSVIKICVDEFLELDQVLGELARETVMKNIASIIIKSSRANDLSARTDENEISLILPHCSKKGAALRAERLRRMIENAQLFDQNYKVTISLGISEYPSLCDSAQSLDDSSRKALHHISDKGGNKICMFKAVDGFQPDFQVNEE